ncbi:FAD-binding oxidoreductase [Pseudonocardia sp.]|uniref:FAD-binding oxidoreductase n=1 Tax=Pseudonocardia sp. TaxID=60912 RepID=UPI003D12C332
MTATLPTLPADVPNVTPQDREYHRLRSTYTASHTPGAILLPRSDSEVAQALRYAAGTAAPVSVRSGGHGLSGRSSNDDGTVIDLSRLSGVEILDPETGLVRVGAGARWAQVAAALSRHDLAISSGDHGGVGVGGLATAGGVGWLVREYGLTIDHVRAATVVLADGSIVRADGRSSPDLLWAVRGAGSYVGVVTDLDIDSMPLSGVAVTQLAIEVDPDGAVLERWAEFMAGAPRALTMSGALVMSDDRPVLVLTAVVASDDPRVAEKALRPLEKLGRVHRGRVSSARYADLVPLEHLHPNLGQQPSTTTNALLRRITADSARALVDVVSHRARPLVQLRALGGAVDDVDPAATAYAHREAHALVTATTFPPYSGPDLDEAVVPLLPYSIGAYRNFETRPDDEAFTRAFPGATGERVKALAGRYDPDGVLSRVDRL